jgi:hypothetical protein
VCCALLCIDVFRRDVALTARRTSSGRLACEICGREISKIKHHRAHGPGRICNPRCKGMKRPTDYDTLDAAPIQRSKKPYESLQPTQKRERRKQAQVAVADVLDRIGCPLEAIQPSSTPSPVDLIHLPTSVRHQLHHSLLRSGDWTTKDIDEWRSSVNDIHTHWKEETNSGAFPKLHMLHHTVDFAERYRFLGRVSESQIESFHARFNSLFHKQHNNQGDNTAERLRRCLADAALRAVQPFLIE